MVSNLFKHVLQVFTCLSMLADSRVFMSLCDFVCGDYIDHDDVVCSHVCCCCVHACHGNVLVLEDCMVVCMCAVWPPAYIHTTMHFLGIKRSP